MNPTVAIVAQGAMGSAIGQRLVERGIHVTTSLAGRSEASAKRAKAAGMVAVSDQETARADFFLSIVPPSDALSLAEKMAGIIGSTNHKPIYVDCNAVNPPTKQQIGAAIAKAGCPFVDCSIIGQPPKDGQTPALYASGEEAQRFAPLGGFGLDVRVIEGPIGAAAALKMSYAGITKGITALGSVMMLAAARGGVADALRKELELSQPHLLAWFMRSVPAMFPKAYRFVGEMEEIADFVGEDEAARQMYQAIAEFYTRMADDFEDKQEETGALAAFLKK
jgi:L-threonate 2-dehydrogenase